MAKGRILGDGRPRVAVIGAGRIGAVHAANLLASGAQVVVVEPDECRGAQLAGRPGLTVVAGLSEVGTVGGYVVASPTDTHARVVSQILDRRVPVLVEKPCCADPVTTRSLGAAADRWEVPLYIGFQRRFAPEYLALRDRVQQGTDRFTYAAFTSFDGAAPPTGYQVAGGSLAFDLQIHDVDLMLWIFGVPVAQVIGMQAEIDEVPDTLLTSVRLANGVVCAIISKRMSGHGCEVYAELVGARTTVRTAEPASAGRYADFRERFADAYTAEMRAFLAVVEGRATATHLATWEDAAQAEGVCRAIETSLRRPGTPKRTSRR